MPNGSVTLDARQFFGLMRPVHRADDVGMALLAGVLGYPAISLVDLNPIRIPPRCEVERMPEPVRGFRGVLASKTRWRMAIVAGGYRPVARLDPTVVLLVHYVAIGARSRIIAQIRIPLRVDKRI